MLITSLLTVILQNFLQVKKKGKGRKMGVNQFNQKDAAELLDVVSELNFPMDKKDELQRKSGKNKPVYEKVHLALDLLNYMNNSERGVTLMDIQSRYKVVEHVARKMLKTLTDILPQITAVKYPNSKMYYWGFHQLKDSLSANDGND